MRVRWLRAALRELDAEITYLAQEDPEAAARRYALIRSRVAELGHFPESGCPGRVPGTRELVIAGLPYLLPYRVRGEELQVLRFFHTSRKPPAQWE